MLLQPTQEPKEVPLYILWNRQGLTGKADPVAETYRDTIYFEHAVTLNGRFVGFIRCDKGVWTMDNIKVPQELVETIGNYLVMWYE